MRRPKFTWAAALLLLVALAPASAAPDPAAKSTGTQNTASEGRAAAYYHLMRATMAAHQGRVRDMLAGVREATRLDPESAELRAEGASLLLSLGQRDDAERLAREALEIDPRQPTAARLLGDLMAARALSGRGDEKSRDEAIRLYSVLAEQGEADDEALGVLSRMQFQAGDGAAAVATARQLAERRKGDVRVTLRIARMLRETGNEGEALSELLNFLARHGEDDILIPHITELARKTGLWAAVEQACARWLEMEPGAIALRKLRGEALVQLEDHAGAVGELERALEADPQDPLVLFHLTNAYSSLGRLADAATAARSLEIAMPGNPTVKAVLGNTLALQGRWEAALEALRSALEGFATEDSGAGRRDVVRRRMAALYLDRELLEPARQLLDELEQPAEPEGLELRVRLALMAGDSSGARRDIGRLRQLGEEGLGALLEGELLAKERKTSRARAKFREAAERLGPFTWARVGEAWRRVGLEAEGERALRDWVAQEPASADAHFTLGGYLERLGRFEQAEASLRAALELDPTHANALNYLGYSLADRDERLHEALGYIRRALDIDPYNGAYLDSLGWVYYRMRRFDEARDPLERAAREYPLDPTVLEHLGDLYLELGEGDRALELWRRALDAGPDDPIALEEKIQRGSRPKPEPRAAGAGASPMLGDVHGP